jgi:cell division protein FtsL
MARYDDHRDNVFLGLWTLSVIATSLGLIFYLALRVRTVELGYELGKAHQELSRLREIERVLLLEVAAHENPERVDLVARTLFGMAEAPPSRVRRKKAEAEKTASGAAVADSREGGP